MVIAMTQPLSEARPKVASIYVRISLDKTGKELGVERQEQECREMCVRLGYEVGQVFVDNDLSATSGVVRPAFERLLKSKPEVVVCWHVDRFIRLSSDLERAVALGIDIHSVKAGMLDLSGASGRMVARIVVAVAQHEGEQKGERQRSSHYQRAARGGHFWGCAPFGYTKGGEPVPGEAEALLRAYKDVLEGKAVTAVARGFNQAGMLTRNGYRWTPATMRRMLLSPRNAGINTYLGEEVGEGTWTAIVPLDLYRGVEALLGGAERKRPWSAGGRKPVSMLSGIARCAKCGSTLRSWRRTGDLVDLYVCRGGGCCTAPMAKFDSLVLHQLVDALSEAEVQRYWLTATDAFDRAGLTARAHVLRGRLEEGAQGFAAGVITMAQLTTMTGALRPELEEVERELTEHREPHRAADLLKDLDVVWDRLVEMDLETLRELVDEVFETIEVRRRGRGGHRPPFGPEHFTATLRGVTQEAPTPEA